MRVIPLISGSSGNATLVETQDSLLLIDIGCSLKRITALLQSVGHTVDELSAVLITHEHSDHISGLGVLTRRAKMLQAFLPEKCLAYLPDSLGKLPEERFHSFEPGDSIRIGNTLISSFRVPHDSADCVGFRIDDCHCRFAISTDIGSMSGKTLDHLSGCGLVMLEANFDTDMLYANEMYSYELKRRILGPGGHLSNEDCGQALAHLAKNGCHEFILAHLSINENMPALALGTVNAYLEEGGLSDGITVTPAARFEPTGIFEVRPYQAMGGNA